MKAQSGTAAKNDEGDRDEYEGFDIGCEAGLTPDVIESQAFLDQHCFFLSHN